MLINLYQKQMIQFVLMNIKTNIYLNIKIMIIIAPKIYNVIMTKIRNIHMIMKKHVLKNHKHVLVMLMHTLERIIPIIHVSCIKIVSILIIII